MKKQKKELDLKRLLIIVFFIGLLIVSGISVYFILNVPDNIKPETNNTEPDIPHMTPSGEL